jgi:phasin family protein
MRNAAEETNRVAATAADATANATRAGADLMQRNGADLMQRNVETVRRAWEGAGHTASEFTTRSMQQFSRVAGLDLENGRRASEDALANIEQIVQSGTVIAGAMQNVFRECVELAQRGTQQNVETIEGLVTCRTPHEFLTAQTELVRNTMEEFIQSTRRIAEISLKMAEDVTGKMSASARGA